MGNNQPIRNMKRLLLFAILFIFSSCTTYEYVYFLSPTELYRKPVDSSESYFVIPADTPLYMSKDATVYRKIKYKKYKGFVYSPNYRYVDYKFKNDTIPANRSINSDSYEPSSGGTVHVKGYYRKDGTYVRPHTRKAPKKRS